MNGNDLEIPTTPAAAESCQYQGCGHFTGEPHTKTRIVDGYCWRCISKAQDLERLAIQMLPAAIAEHQNNGHYLMESVIERAIYAAQMMQAKCLNAAIK